MGFNSGFKGLMTVMVLHKEYRWIGIDHMNTEILGSDPSVNTEACFNVYLSRSSAKDQFPVCIILLDTKIIVSELTGCLYRLEGVGLMHHN